MKDQHEKLSLDLGGSVEAPSVSTFRISGELMSLAQELGVDEDVQVMVMGPDGQILLSKYARCSSVGFIRHRKKGNPPWVEHTHKIKLLDEEG